MMKYKAGDKVTANDRRGVKIRDGVVVEVGRDPKYPYFVKNRNILDDIGWVFAESEVSDWVPDADDE